MGVNANDFQFAQDRREYVDGQIDLHDASGEAHPDIQVKLLECLEALDGTVKQVDGMGLSANDYSDSEKQKLANALAIIAGVADKAESKIIAEKHCRQCNRVHLKLVH